ncbi:MAG: GNAT family N-acetyltransferase [Kofleriaceae bacterium]
MHRPWWSDATEVLTDRLRLRAIRLDDAAELRAAMWDNRDHLSPWIEVPRVEPSLAWMHARVQALVDACEAGRAIRYLVYPLEGGPLLGCVGLAIGEHASVELSYWLAAAHTGKGHAREMVAAVSRLAFERGPIERVVIECVRSNLRSAQVARGAGFARTAIRDDVEVWMLTRGRLRAWEQVLGASATLGPAHGAEDGSAIRVIDRSGDALEIRFADLTGSLVVASCDVAAESVLSARDCLTHNTTLAVGALCLGDGRIQLRHACAPHELTPYRIATAAREAARLRGIARARLPEDAAFDHVL